MSLYAPAGPVVDTVIHARRLGDLNTSQWHIVAHRVPGPHGDSWAYTIPESDMANFREQRHRHEIIVTQRRGADGAWETVAKRARPRSV